ncbi:MAG: PAS domain-containing protein [Betaproteobacteria bacterium]|nr:PAS domain-containing protein [Betaproteobacteria bacterium]
MTDPVRMDAANRSESRLLDLFFDSNLSCAVLLDREFNFIRVNRAYASACGRDVSEFPGHNHFDFYPSDAKAIFEEVVRTKRAFSTRARAFEFPDHPEWGVTYWDWNLVPVVDARGDVEVLFFCLNDVTESRRRDERMQQVMMQLSKLSSQLVDAQESERRRIARILHEEIGQELMAVKLTIQNRVTRSPGCGEGLTHDVLEGLNQVIGRLRQISLDLRPPVLDDLGLVPALVWLISQERSQTGLEVSFRHCGLNGRLPQEIETAVYRIAQEALSNITRHSGVKRATVDLHGTADSIALRVEDRGRGFGAKEVSNSGTGSGLMGMRERARSLGGRVSIEPVPGTGTIVIAELPLGQPAPQG